MKMEVLEFNERMKEQSKKYLKETKFQSECQKKIDFVRFNGWLMDSQVVKAKCETNAWIYRQLLFQFSNISVEDFIEHILGPFHLKFNINWHLELDGDESDPVFVFTNIKDIYSKETKFRVKEGEFTTCKVIKEFSHIPELPRTVPVYNLRMVCE